MDAITDLEGVLGVSNPLARAQATRRIKAARDFQVAVGRRVRELDGSHERTLRELRASGAYAF